VTDVVLRADAIEGPSAEGTAPDVSQLGRKVRAGVGWSLVNGVSVRLLTVGSAMVVARLISPQQYGVFAIGFLVLTALTSMNELGVSVSIVRWPTDPTDFAPTAVTLSMASSVLLYAVIVVVAPAVARLLGAPEATTVIRIVAFNVVLDGISSIPNAFLTRTFKQGRRTLVDLAAFVPSAGLSIFLVASGWGATGLAWGSLAGNVTAVIMVYALAPVRPLPGWRTSDARALVRAGLPFAATSAVYLATLNVDYVVIGHALGTAALGFYVLAFTLSSWPANLVSLSIRRVAIPGFSSLAHDAEALRKAFARSVHLVAACAVLMAVLLSMLAGPLVAIFYGSKWSPAVATLRWLAVLGGARVVLDLCYDVLVATGRGRSLLAAQAAWFVSLAIALPLAAAAAGIRGVGIGHVAVAVGIVGPVYAVALRHAGIPLRSVLSALVAPCVGGAVAVAILAAGAQLGLGPWTRLLLLGGAAAAAYGSVIALHPENRTVLKRVLARPTS